MNNFLNLPWHDAEILSIVINREDDEHQDVVTIYVRWPDTTESTISFTNCYGLIAHMNFGVIGIESVRSALVLDNRDDIEEIRTKWWKVGVDLANLKCFEIETNSTASKIEVYACGFLLTP